MAQANHPGASALLVVHYSRRALALLLTFGAALVALGCFLFSVGELSAFALVLAGLIVLAHAVRYLVATRLVTILPTGLIYHGFVKSFRADWSQISKVGAGQGEEVADSFTFHATGPFGVFGEFAINELLIRGPKGELAAIAEALERAQRGAHPTSQFGKRRPLSF
ncbi:hypothetical protein [Erythrobacter oryzae]|uniref:hypothetical protein n=1 Tax=Erythrobacter oryzae TaxID=3019556 RepID=UPI0025535F6F|nr:hypothetical protein [Erythrobacter sp. COR-2]